MGNLFCTSIFVDLIALFGAWPVPLSLVLQMVEPLVVSSLCSRHCLCTPSRMEPRKQSNPPQPGSPKQPACFCFLPGMAKSLFHARFPRVPGSFSYVTSVPARVYTAWGEAASPASTDEEMPAPTGEAAGSGCSNKWWTENLNPQCPPSKPRALCTVLNVHSLLHLLQGSAAVGGMLLAIRGLSR